MISSGEEHRPVENQAHEPTSTEETKLIVADQTVSSEIGGMLGDGFPAVDDLVHSEIGQYWVEEIIGRGSMGRVYRATHMSLERPCALKIMSPGLLRRKPLIRDRFWAEARAVAGLVHPHIVTVHNLLSIPSTFRQGIQRMPGAQYRACIFPQHMQHKPAGLARYILVYTGIVSSSLCQPLSLNSEDIEDSLKWFVQLEVQNTCRQGNSYSSKCL